jgi:ABC-type glycerol-3-phosphate transport system substrate-binding protein
MDLRTRPTGGRLVRLVAAIATAVVLVAAACGGGTRARPTTLRVMMTDDWVTPPFLDAVRDFEKAHSDVRVSLDKAPIKGMLEAIKGGVANGNAPDVVQAHAFSAAAQGLAEPLDDLWAKALEPSDFFPGAIEDVTWGNHRYGVPLDTNALVLMYNADQLRAAGATVPAGPMTFEDFRTLARAVTSPDGSRRGIAVPTSSWWTLGWIEANGGETVRVDGDGRPTFTLDAKVVVDAVGYLAALVRQGVAFPPAAANSHATDALALFQTGSAAMHASGSWDLAKLRSGPQGGDYRAAPMPRGFSGLTNGSAMGGSSMYVPRGSRHRQLAFEFMVNLIDDRYAMRLARDEGRLPVRQRLYRDPYFADPNLEVFLEQLKTAHPETLSAFPEANAAFGRAIDQAIREGRDAGEALAEAQRAAEASAPR